MAFFGSLPEIPSFGQQFARQMGQGLSQGFGKVGDLLLERLSKGDIASDIQKLRGNKQPSTSDRLSEQNVPQDGQQQRSEQGGESQKDPFDLSDLSPTEKVRLAQKYPNEMKFLQGEEKESGKEKRAEKETENKRYQPQLEAADAARNGLSRRKMALDLFKTSSEEGVGTLSKSNLARIGNELVGKEIFTPDNAGAMMNYAAKTSLTESLDKVKAKGLTLFLEKRLSEAQPQIGQSKQANMSSILPMQAAYDIDKKYLDTIQELEEKGGISSGNVIKTAQKEAAKFADERMKQLSREIQENIESTQTDRQLLDIGYEGNPKNVPQGTPLTDRRAILLLGKYGYKENGDEKENEKALKTATSIAKQLGYEID